MTPQRILGLVLLVVGLALLAIGISSSHSMADQVSNAFTGRFTDNTLWFIIGGIVAGVASVGMFTFGAGGKKA